MDIAHQTQQYRTNNQQNSIAKKNLRLELLSNARRRSQGQLAIEEQNTN